MENINNLLPVLAKDGELAVVSVDGQPVVTARALARALEYKNDTAIYVIINRNRDCFHERGFHIESPFQKSELKYDTAEIGIETPGGIQKVRVFTKRGALKICMKSNQPKAIQVQEMLLDLYEAVESRRLVPMEALNEVTRRLDELSLEVKRLADLQQSKIIFLSKPSKPGLPT